MAITPADRGALAGADDGPARRPSDPALAVAARPFAPRVLIADDEAYFRSYYTEVLAPLRYDVDSAASGEETLQRLSARDYDLALIDLAMPGWGGLDLLARILELNPGLAVVVTTPREGAGLGESAVRAGAAHSLIKPVNRQELVGTVQSLIAAAARPESGSFATPRGWEPQLVRACIEASSTLDLEQLTGRFLDLFCQATEAQGSAMWTPSLLPVRRLTRSTFRGLFGAEGRDEPIELDHPLLSELQRVKLPLIQLEGEASDTPRGPAGPGLHVPVFFQDRLVAYAVLQEKISGQFDGADAEKAQIIAEFAGAAIHNALRFEAVQKTGLRDRETNAYSMTYFVDYAGKEIFKARRYRRSFSISNITIDNAPQLRGRLPQEFYREAAKRLARAVTESIRDADVLARTGEAEFILMMPESDYLQTLSTLRACRERFHADPAVMEIESQAPITLTMGAAAFPRDGRDFDELMGVCRARMEATRGSLFRTMLMDSLSFADACEVLVREAQALSREATEPGPVDTMQEQLRGLTRGHVFAPGAYDAVVRLVIHHLTDYNWKRVELFWGEPDGLRARDMLAANARAAGRDIRWHFIAPGASEAVEGKSIQAIEPVPAPVFRYLVTLTEQTAYAVMVDPRGGPAGETGFHTADPFVVEQLVAKLFASYPLRPKTGVIEAVGPEASA